MKYAPLPKQQLIDVIEGRKNASRIPILVHFWITPDVFGDRKSQFEEILSKYPEDVWWVTLKRPDTYKAPMDDPSYRWSYMDAKEQVSAFDHSGVIKDWETQLEPLLADFPNPEYPGLIPTAVPPDDGRYRLGVFWWFYFEVIWQLRNMDDVLIDFYEEPEAIHAVFRKLTDFYKRMLTRARDELQLNGIFTSDDLGTQTSTFFSPKFFDEFFAPYYKEVIDHVHSLGMHFWLHTCGNIESLLTRFIDLGIDVLHPIQKYTMDEKRVSQIYGNRITIWAGFDVQQTIPYGTPEDVRREVRFMMDTYSRSNGRFMFTLGNRLTKDTPLESLEALLDEAFTYGKRIVREKK